jgi:hypothetical protein
MYYVLQRYNGRGPRSASTVSSILIVLQSSNYNKNKSITITRYVRKPDRVPENSYRVFVTSGDLNLKIDAWITIANNFLFIKTMLFRLRLYIYIFTYVSRLVSANRKQTPVWLLSCHHNQSQSSMCHHIAPPANTHFETWISTGKYGSVKHAIFLFLVVS